MAIPANVRQYYEDFTNVTSVTVTHNLGYKPIVVIQWADGVGGYVYMAIMAKITHTDTTEFVIDFGNYALSGRITYA